MKTSTRNKPSGMLSALKEEYTNYPSISLIINPQTCAPPDGSVSWSWRAVPNDSLINLSVSKGDRELFCMKNMPAQGEYEWVVPKVIRLPSELTITMAVEVSGEVVTQKTLPLLIDVRPKLVITGLEITQGIQTFNRTDGTPDNSLDVVSYKDTIVRVYLSADRNGFNNDLVPDVTGVLEFDGFSLSPINGQVPENCGSWSGGNPFIIARPAAQVDRQQTDHTLNFRIPAALATPGNHVLGVRVTSPEICGEPVGTYWEMLWQWKSANELPIRYVRVKDNHPQTGTKTMPTDEEALCSVVRAFDLLPSPATDIGPAKVPEMITDHDLMTIQGAASLASDISDKQIDCGWLSDFLGQCGTFKVGPIWIGLHNNGWGYAPSIHNVVVGNTYNPTGSDPCGIRRVNAAHEIGHRLDLDHVKIGCRTGGLSSCYIPTPQYGTYSPENGGYLWDVPFDPFLNTVISGSVGDFMSYACPAWTSGASWKYMRVIIG